MIKSERMKASGLMTERQMQVIQRDIQQVFKVYFETTKIPFEAFMQLLKILAKDRTQMYAQNAGYAGWLLGNILNMLDAEYEVTADALIQNEADLYAISLGHITTAKSGTVPTGDATPRCWAKLGMEYLKRLFGLTLSGKPFALWDAYCDGGLCTEWGASLFLSSNKAASVEVASGVSKDAVAFELDFTGALDYDAYNLLFSCGLPEELQRVLREDEPLMIYINPEQGKDIPAATELSQHMADMLPSIANKKLDNTVMRSLYRLCLLKDTYNLKNLRIGVFTPLSWLTDKAYTSFREFFEQHFGFCGGFLVSSAGFAGVKEKQIAASFWSADAATVQDGRSAQQVLGGAADTKQGTSYVFDVYIKLDDDSVTQRGVFNLRTDVHTMMDWCKAQHSASELVSMPLQKAWNRFDIEHPKLEVSDALAFMPMYDKVKDSTHVNMLYALPSKDSLAITPANFWRCAVAVGTRIAFTGEDSPHIVSQNLLEPDVYCKGWNAYAADCLGLMLFTYCSMNYAYRMGSKEASLTQAAVNRAQGTDGKPSGKRVMYSHPLQRVNNRLFPLDIKKLQDKITDDILLQDIADNYYDNSFILQCLKDAKPLMSSAVLDMVDYCLGLMKASLTGEARMGRGYAAGTAAYDADFAQIFFGAQLSTFTLTQQMTYKKKYSKAMTAVRKQADAFGIITPIVMG